MSDRLLLLGTGTCQLEAERAASSVLLELGDLRLVFDFGRGVTRRLAQLGLGQDEIEHIVISCGHGDDGRMMPQFSPHARYVAPGSLTTAPGANDDGACPRYRDFSGS